MPINFLLVRHSNRSYLAPSQRYWRFFAPHPYSNLIMVCSHLTRLPMLGSARAFILSYLCVKLFSNYSNLCDHGTWTSQTDRRTDRDIILWHNGAMLQVKTVVVYIHVNSNMQWLERWQTFAYRLQQVVVESNSPIFFGNQIDSNWVMNLYVLFKSWIWMN